MKITKRQLRRIIREEKRRILVEQAAEAIEVAEQPPPAPEAEEVVIDKDETLEDMAQEIISTFKKGRILGIESLWDADQVFIRTGPRDGITVQVVQRGRPSFGKKKLKAQ